MILSGNSTTKRRDMKYDLKKKIEQNMKMLELKSNKEFSVFMRYPNPSKHELVGSCNFCGVVV